MEINDLLQDEFLREWNRLSTRSASSALNLIRSEFQIKNVENSINENTRLLSFTQKQLRERYHETNLRALTKTFAQTLFETSNRGLVIDRSSIIAAKSRMKSNGNCDIYPC